MKQIKFKEVYLGNHIYHMGHAIEVTKIVSRYPEYTLHLGPRPINGSPDTRIKVSGHMDDTINVNQ